MAQTQQRQVLLFLCCLTGTKPAFMQAKADCRYSGPLCADGSYTVVGRARDLIISGGENIPPLEIEAALCEHPAVAECAAFGLADPRWGEAVAVAVVLHPGAALSDDALRAHLAGRLARFKLPRRVFFVQALPKTALGKLQRTALKALAN